MWVFLLVAVVLFCVFVVIININKNKELITKFKKNSYVIEIAKQTAEELLTQIDRQVSEYQGNRSRLIFIAKERFEIRSREICKSFDNRFMFADAGLTDLNAKSQKALRKALVELIETSAISMLATKNYFKSYEISQQYDKNDLCGVSYSVIIKLEVTHNLPVIREE